MEWKPKAKVSPFSADKENQNSNLIKTKNSLNNVLYSMRLDSLTPKQTQTLNQTQRAPLSIVLQPTSNKIQDLTQTDPISDKTSLLSDEILLRILSMLPKSQRSTNFLVSKRWLNLQGRLVRSVNLRDWDFLLSGRLFLRFPNLVGVDLVNGCFVSPRNSGIFCTRTKNVSFHVSCHAEGKDWIFNENLVLDADDVDRGLRVLADLYPNLRKLVVLNCSEMGLLNLADHCPKLQELELLKCSDLVLRGIAACHNLQVLRLTGIVEGLYDSLVSDVGLTILAQGCKSLVKLELSGCKGSYEGIKAIGLCCQMLEELCFRNHKMEDGWLTALSFCQNLKKLRFVLCKAIDGNDGVNWDFESCPALESLHLEKCQLRDKSSLKLLLLLCCTVRKLAIESCWGLNDDTFMASSVLRKVRFLSLEGCSMLTTHGLEYVITHWDELESLKVYSCNNVKDCEVNPALSAMFSALKSLRWKPDMKHQLSANLVGSNMGKRGGKFFKRSADWKSLPGA